MAKRVRVMQESGTGRNQRFYDPDAGRHMSRSDFVRRIEQGEYSGYHVRKVSGVKTPVSNPDQREGNNLD